MQFLLPLSEKLRPDKFEQIAGQEHLLTQDGVIFQSVLKQKARSLLLYGPPGTGKTTLAKLYAKSFPLPFLELKGSFSSVSDLKKIVKEQADHPLLAQTTIVFIDEIHRFNKAQQDAFLPLMEEGNIILLGATTEFPSFVLNGALLSRLQVLELKSLSKENLQKILTRFIQNIYPISLEDGAREFLLEQAHGDGRFLLNLLENLPQVTTLISIKEIENLLTKRAPSYDKNGDLHHQCISAFHKSVRGSDPDASLYYLSRMLKAGEDPLFICRRMIRIASEDVGLADPHALGITIHAMQSYKMLGSPEGELALAQAAVYLALAPKSNALYVGFEEALADAENTHHLPPPKIIINAPTTLHKKQGYGEGYIYDHDTARGFSGQNYFPDGHTPKSYYSPKERGFEREMQKRLNYFQKLKEKK